MLWQPKYSIKHLINSRPHTESKDTNRKGYVLEPSGLPDLIVILSPVQTVVHQMNGFYLPESVKVSDEVTLSKLKRLLTLMPAGIPNDSEW